MPTNNFKLQNIVVVRVTSEQVWKKKKKKKNFEIACTPNKVDLWRAGKITDINDVVEIKRVFENVKTAKLAKREDLQKVFGTTNQDEIIKTILKTGKIQVSEFERKMQLNRKLKDVLEMVSNMVIHTKTGTRVTNSFLQKALKDLGFKVHPHKSTKQLALVATRLLIESKYPLERSQMKVSATLSIENSNKIRAWIVSNPKIFVIKVQVNRFLRKRRIYCLIEPSVYKKFVDRVKKLDGTVSVLKKSEKKPSGA